MQIERADQTEIFRGKRTTTFQSSSCAVTAPQVFFFFFNVRETENEVLLPDRKIRSDMESFRNIQPKILAKWKAPWSPIRSLPRQALA